MATHRQHALIIGINRYSAMPHANLRGCANDARLMRGVLVGDFGVAPDDVEILLDAEASRDGILAAFARLEGRVGPDDGVIIFYAGHGSRVRTADGWRETLVAADSGRVKAPNRDILDFEIDAHVQRLNEKTRWVTLLFDCCHSGSVTRDDAVGLREVEPETRALDQLAARLPDGPIGRDKTFVPGQRQAVLVAACRADEKAREALDAETGQHHGALTLSLAGVLAKLTGPATWQEVVGAVAPRLTARHPRQHPVLEGAMDTVVFQRKERRAGARLAVVACDEDGVTLSGGAVHGVTRGSRWRLEPTVTEGTPVTVEILEVEGVQSRVAPRAGVDIGWRAVPEAVRLPSPRLSVALGDGAELPELLEEIAERPLLERVALGMASVTVRQRGGSWQAVGTDGRFATREHPRSDWRGLVDDLERVARFQGLLGMEFPDQDVALADGVRLSIERRTERGAIPARPEQGDGLPSFAEGDRAEFVIENTTDDLVYVSLAQFGVDRSVTLLLPVAHHPNENPDGYPLEAGETLRLAADYFSVDPRFGADVADGLKLRLPEAFPWAAEPGEVQTSGLITLRLMVTRTPADFSFLVQGATRASASVGTLEAMMRLFSTGHGTRNFFPERASARRAQAYAVQTRAITVVRDDRQISPSNGGEVLFYAVTVDGVVKGEVGISHPSMNQLPKETAFWGWYPSSWPAKFNLEPETGGVPESQAVSRVQGTQLTTSPRFGTTKAPLEAPPGLLDSWRVDCGGTTVAYLGRTSSKLYWYSPSISKAWLPWDILEFVDEALPVGQDVYTAIDIEQ